MNKKLFAKISVISFLVLAVFTAGYFAGDILDLMGQKVGLKAGLEVRQGGNYKFINPLLECEVAQGAINARKENFEKDLNDLVQTQVDKGRVSKMGIYFRDLNNGPNFGINQNEPFLPASLLKVPVMMAYFSYAETNPAILQKKNNF